MRNELARKIKLLLWWYEVRQTIVNAWAHLPWTKERKFYNIKLFMNELFGNVQLRLFRLQDLNKKPKSYKFLKVNSEKCETTFQYILKKNGDNPYGKDITFIFENFEINVVMNYANIIVIKDINFLGTNPLVRFNDLMRLTHLLFIDQFSHELMYYISSNALPYTTGNMDTKIFITTDLCNKLNGILDLIMSTTNVSNEELGMKSYFEHNLRMRIRLMNEIVHYHVNRRDDTVLGITGSNVEIVLADPVGLLLDELI